MTLTQKIFWLVGLGLLFLGVLLELQTGFVSAHWRNPLSQTVLWQIRLPCSLTAIIAGASLALSGCVYQAVLQNPLAEPYLLGISSGAALGAAVAITLGITWVAGPALMMALVVLLLVFGLAQATQRFSNTNLILAGIVLGSLANALVLLLIKFSGNHSKSILFWLLGDISILSYTKLALMGAILLGVFLILWKSSRALNLFVLKESEIQLLGVALTPLKIFLLFLASILVAMTVANVGIIGFLGLIVPHLVRGFTGGQHEKLLPGAMLGGALMLLYTDWIVHWPLWPETLPVGLVTAFLGAPIFFFILLRKSRHA